MAKHNVTLVIKSNHIFVFIKTMAARWYLRTFIIFFFWILFLLLLLKFLKANPFNFLHTAGYKYASSFAWFGSWLTLFRIMRVVAIVIRLLSSYFHFLSIPFVDVILVKLEALSAFILGWINASEEENFESFLEHRDLVPLEFVVVRVRFNLFQNYLIKDSETVLTVHDTNCLNYVLVLLILLIQTFMSFNQQKWFSPALLLDNLNILAFNFEWVYKFLRNFVLVWRVLYNTQVQILLGWEVAPNLDVTSDHLTLHTIFGEGSLESLENIIGLSFHNFLLFCLILTLHYGQDRVIIFVMNMLTNNLRGIIMMVMIVKIFHRSIFNIDLSI